MIISHVCNSHTVTCMLFFCSSRAEMGSTPTRSWRTLIFALFTPTPLMPAPLLLPLSLPATHSNVCTICSWVLMYPVEQAVAHLFQLLTLVLTLLVPWSRMVVCVILITSAFDTHLYIFTYNCLFIFFYSVLIFYCFLKLIYNSPYVI